LPDGSELTTIVLWNCEVPSGPFTDRVAVYVPGVVNVWLTFCPIALPPSLKDHVHDVIEPVEWSVNDTVRGAIPIDGVAVNEACGSADVTTIALLLDDEPPGPLTVRVAV
jgi:hypothetical protein